ncbi:MAG: hypothetical protein ACREJ2_00075 [Planctomycetota bacterium]
MSAMPPAAPAGPAPVQPQAGYGTTGEPNEEDSDAASGNGAGGDLVATAEFARITTLRTLGKVSWQDPRFRTRTVLEVGSYIVPHPQNPANRVFLLQDRNPTWAGGWLLIRRGPGGEGFALFDEAGHRVEPVLLARADLPGAQADPGPAGWELVRLAWNADGGKHFFLYSEPLEKMVLPKLGTVPNDFPPLLLRTFPVPPARFAGINRWPLGVETMRTRLFDPHEVHRGTTGRRFSIDDRINPFGSMDSQDYYASTYDGFLSVPVAGRYDFFLDYDEYGLLLIDAHWPIDVEAMAEKYGPNWRAQIDKLDKLGKLAKLKPTPIKYASRTHADTLHFHWTRPLEFNLDAGLHRITLIHAEVTGDQGARLAWELPDESQPHLIAPDSFQSILPAGVLGAQRLSTVDRSEPKKPTAADAAFIDAVQVDLIERLLVNGDTRNRIARLRAQWRPAPPPGPPASPGPPGSPAPASPAAAASPASATATATATAAAVHPVWRLDGRLELNDGQPSDSVYFCVPVGAPAAVTLASAPELKGAPAASAESAAFQPTRFDLTIPNDLSDQGYLQENVQLAIDSETTFCFPGEDWTLHLSADCAEGDLIRPRLHIQFATRNAAPGAAGHAVAFDARAARLRINGLDATPDALAGSYTIDLPWNGPTRTPIRLDLDPAALLGAAGKAVDGTDAGALVMTAWIEACGAPLATAAWTFRDLRPHDPAVSGGAGAGAGAGGDTGGGAGGGAGDGNWVARRGHLEWIAAAAPTLDAAPPPGPARPWLLPPFDQLPEGNPHLVVLLGREDPALHRRSLVTATLAGELSTARPAAVLFVGDTLTAVPDLKRLAEESAGSPPQLAAPPDLPPLLDPRSVGPAAAAADLASHSTSGRWLYLPLDAVYRYSLHPWPTAGAKASSDSSNLFGATVNAGDAPACTTAAIAAALSALDPLPGGNGLAVVSLGPRDCRNALPLVETVRGLDATISELRRLGYPRVIVVGITPVPGDGNFLTAGAAELNGALADLCTKLGVDYIDAIAQLRSVDPELTGLFRAPDGERILLPYPNAGGLDALRKAVLHAQ